MPTSSARQFRNTRIIQCNAMQLIKKPEPLDEQSKAFYIYRRDCTEYESLYVLYLSSLSTYEYATLFSS